MPRPTCHDCSENRDSKKTTKIVNCRGSFRILIELLRYHEGAVVSCVFLWLLLCVASPWLGGKEPPVDVPLHRNTFVRFATLDEAKQHLEQHDPYIGALSRFDRQCRMTTSEDPTNEEL